MTWIRTENGSLINTAHVRRIGLMTNGTTLRTHVVADLPNGDVDIVICKEPKDAKYAMNFISAKLMRGENITQDEIIRYAIKKSKED